MATGRHHGLCAPGDTIRHVRPASTVFVQPGAPEGSDDTVESDGESEGHRGQKTPLSSLAALTGGGAKQLVRRRSGPRALGPQEKEMFIRARHFVVRSRLTDIQEGKFMQQVRARCATTIVPGASPQSFVWGEADS